MTDAHNTYKRLSLTSYFKRSSLYSVIYTLEIATVNVMYHYQISHPLLMRMVIKGSSL